MVKKKSLRIGKVIAGIVALFVIIVGYLFINSTITYKINNNVFGWVLIILAIYSFVEYAIMGPRLK